MKTQYFLYTPIQQSLKRGQDNLHKWFETGARILDLYDYPLKKLAKNIGKLSSLLISGKFGNYMEKNELLSAYFAFFFPQGYYRTFFVLEEILRLTNFEPEDNMIINDLGTGPGASIFAAYDIFKDYNPVITGIEKSKNALELAKIIAEKQRIKLNLFHGDFNKFELKGEIAILSSALSEQKNSLKIVEKIMESHRLLILIEPGWREGYEIIMKISDILKLHPILPCQGNVCKIRGKDWCHAALPFTLPDLTVRVNSLLSHKLKYIKFTYGVFSSKVSLKTKAPRIISPKIREKGKEIFIVCDGGEVYKIEKLKKQSIPDFDYASCCDLISFEGEIKGNAVRLKSMRLLK